MCFILVACCCLFVLLVVHYSLLPNTGRVSSHQISKDHSQISVKLWLFVCWLRNKSLFLNFGVDPGTFQRIHSVREPFNISIKLSRIINLWRHPAEPVLMQIKDPERCGDSEKFLITDLHFHFSSIDLYIHFLVRWPYGIFSVYLFNNKKNWQMKLSSLTDMEADVFELLSVSGAFEGVTLTIMNTQTWEQSDVIKRFPECQTVPLKVQSPSLWDEQGVFVDSWFFGSRH